MLCKNKLFSLFIIVLCTFTLTSKAVTLSDVQQKLTMHSLLRGQFTQIKRLQMFNAPLTSTGTFLLDQDNGLLWQQVDPFSVSLVLVEGKLSQQFADQDAEVIVAKDNPMVFYFSHLFLSLFKGDMDALTKQFDIVLSEKSTHWLLLLTPTSAPLNKVFATISIEGSEFIHSLILTELSGDISEIQFTNHRTTPNKLNENEQRAFQF